MLYIWKAKGFEHSHECADVQELKVTLCKCFSKYETAHLLLSPRINSCELDALLLTDGGIVIFEMKHVYSDVTITVTENKWTCSNGYQIKGGSENDEGPFSQASRYRHKLDELLRKHHFLSVVTSNQDYKRLIKVCVIVSPACPKGKTDSGTISEKWFSFCRTDHLHDTVLFILENGKPGFFSNEDLVDFIQERIGIDSFEEKLDTGNSEEANVKFGGNEDESENLRRSVRRAEEKNRSKMNKRKDKKIQKLEKKIELLEQNTALQKVINNASPNPRPLQSMDLTAKVDTVNIQSPINFSISSEIPEGLRYRLSLIEGGIESGADQEIVSDGIVCLWKDNKNIWYSSNAKMNTSPPELTEYFVARLMNACVIVDSSKYRDIPQERLVADIDDWIGSEDDGWMKGLCKGKFLIWSDVLLDAERSETSEDVRKCENDTIVAERRNLEENTFETHTSLSPCFIDLCKKKGSSPNAERVRNTLCFMDEDLNWYMQHYFPRSFGEGFCVFDGYLGNGEHDFKLTTVKILDVGCGTGGELIGILAALRHHHYSRIKKLEILLVDGNQLALQMCKSNIKTYLDAHWDGVTPEIEEKHYVFQGMTASDTFKSFGSKNFDFVLGSKIISEESFRRAMPLDHVLDVFSGFLKKGGTLYISDVVKDNNILKGNGKFYVAVKGWMLANVEKFQFTLPHTDQSVEFKVDVDEHVVTSVIDFSLITRVK